MAKRAIYLDDHERDLARRAFDFLIHLGREAASIQSHRSVTDPALHWFADSLSDLRAKFEEPTPKRPNETAEPQP